MADTFLESFADVHPEIEIETFDLWDGSLPEFGPAAAAAKMAVFAGQQPEGDGADAWQRARATFDRFDAADRYLFSVPMWNAGVPYILKQFIDVVIAARHGLRLRSEHRLHRACSGQEGGHRSTPARSTASDDRRVVRFGLPAPYLRDWLHWAGIDDITEVAFRPNLATADAEVGRQIAHAEARDAGKTF